MKRTLPPPPVDDSIATDAALAPPFSGLLSSAPDHWYSEDELDAIEAIDVEFALRIDRAQFLAGRESDLLGGREQPVDAAAVARAIDEARQLLAQDGGDLELVEIDDRVVRVRMKGACAGCPNAPLDLRNIVERLVRSRSPGVRSVVNEF